MQLRPAEAPEKFLGRKPERSAFRHEASEGKTSEPSEREEEVVVAFLAFSGEPGNREQVYIRPGS